MKICFKNLVHFHLEVHVQYLEILNQQMQSGGVNIIEAEENEGFSKKKTTVIETEN